MSRALVGGVLPLLMKARELRVALGLSRTTFWKLQRAGVFDTLRAPIARHYSGAKVQGWLADGQEPARTVHLSQRRRTR